MQRLAIGIIFALLCSLPAWTQISRTGSCAAQATSCTLSAVNSGDLIVCQGYRSASTTAPSLPGSNTSVLTLSTSSSGTTGAERMWCRKASSGSDTGSGTSTNASTVACIAYSGTGVGTTTNCATTGLGGHASNQAKASTTIDYPAITMSRTDNTSWVAEFAGDSAAVPGGSSDTTSVVCAPSNCSTAGIDTQAADTNATVTAHADHTVSVTSSTWLTAVAEILLATVATPTYNYDAGTYSGSVTVTISDATGGSSVVYCTDTSNTCTPGASYVSPVTISTTGTYLRSQATKSGMESSAVKSALYTITTPCTSNCPTLAQDVSWGSNDSQDTAVNNWIFNLPNPTLGGSSTQGDASNNTVVMAIYWGGGGSTTTISSITDDGPGGGNTWSTGPTCNDGGSPKTNIQISYVSGIKQGTQKVMLAFSGNTSNVLVRFAEFYNVGAMDGSSCTATGLSGPTLTAGSITPSATYDLIYQFGANGSLCCGNPVTSYVPGSGFNLLPSDRIYGAWAQWTVDGSTSPINPTMTASGNTDSWLSAAIAFKSAAAGTAPSATAIRIMREWHFLMGSGVNGATQTVQWPCYGNLSVLLNGEGPIYHPLDATTPVADTDSNTYSKVTAPSAQPYMFYAANQTCSSPNSRTVTLKNGTGISAGSTWVFYDVVNAATSPYDTSAVTAPGATQSVTGTSVCGAAGDTDHSPDITPTAGPGVVFVVTNEGTGPICALRTPATYIFDSAWATGITDGSSELDNGNAHGHVYYSGTPALDFHWDWANNGGGPSDINALAASFKQAPAAASGTRKRVMVTTN